MTDENKPITQPHIIIDTDSPCAKCGRNFKLQIRIANKIYCHYCADEFGAALMVLAGAVEMRI